MTSLHRAGYFGGIDAVRFAAALLVVGFHLDWVARIRPSTSVAAIIADGRSLAAPPFGIWFGWVGVQVFFVISGLVIAGSATRETPMAFLKSRLLRLYPAGWICAVLCACILLGIGMTQGLGVRLLNSLALLPTPPWLSPVYWTLAVEVVFYAVVFAWRIVLPRGSLAALAIALTIWSAAYQFAIAAGLHPSAQGHEQTLLLQHGAFFAVGIFLWLRAAGEGTLWNAAAFVVAATACVCQIARKTAEEGHDAAAAVVPLAIWTLLVIAILISTTPRAVRAAASPHAQPILRKLGLMTYPLYLIHLVLGGLVLRFWTGAQLNRQAGFFVAVIVVLAVSYATMIAERPIRQGLRSVLDALERRLLLGRPSFQSLYRPPGG